MAWLSTWFLFATFFTGLYSFVLDGSLLCGKVKEVTLTPGGHESSITLTLANRIDNNLAEPCALNILAPDVYALSIAIIEVKNLVEESSKRKKTEKVFHGNKKERKTSDCNLNIYYKNNAGAPAWNKSLCSPEFLSSRSLSGDLGLNNATLLSPPLRVEWWPPSPPRSVDNLRLIITAINTGDMCLSKSQVVCMRLGDAQIFCVSDTLACDGVAHCPGTGWDESMALCDHRKTILYIDLAKRLWPKHMEHFLGLADVLPQAYFIPNSTDPILKINQKPRNTTKNALKVLEEALAPYGSWAYLAMGILICISMMFVFCIWEYFCPATKPTPLTGIPAACLAPAAVLSTAPPFSRRQLPAQPRPPPTYEELEQPPPSYNILFPEDNVSEATAGSDNQTRPQPSSSNQI